MSSQICLDASFVVALLVPEYFSPVVLKLWQDWIQAEKDFVAPTLLHYEVTSALFRKQVRHLIEPGDAQAALQHFLALDITLVNLPDLAKRAMAIATQFQRPNTYDAFYLALAEYLDCPCWTADERLYNAVQAQFTWIAWVGNPT